MPPVGFKPTIPASERPQTHALDRAANGIGTQHNTLLKFKFFTHKSYKNAIFSVGWKSGSVDEHSHDRLLYLHADYVHPFTNLFQFRRLTEQFFFAF
jgi:hypothetical protein